MSQKSAAFRWTPQREQAALLVAQDKLTDEEIANQVHVDRRTLARWKTDREFRQRVDEHIEEIRQRIRRRGIAVMENRVQRLQDRWEAMQQVMAERASDPEMQDVPGGKTGLLVRTVKSVGAGDKFRTVEVYAVDTGLLKELRDHERQASQELGQWLEKHEHTGKDGQPIFVKVLRGVSMDDL